MQCRDVGTPGAVELVAAAAGHSAPRCGSEARSHAPRGYVGGTWGPSVAAPGRAAPPPHEDLGPCGACDELTPTGILDAALRGVSRLPPRAHACRPAPPCGAPRAPRQGGRRPNRRRKSHAARLPRRVSTTCSRMHELRLAVRLRVTDVAANQRLLAARAAGQRARAISRGAEPGGRRPARVSP
jgi:hypothetical protein